MSYQQKVRNAWKKNNSLLCIGLDPNQKKFPSHINSIFEFNKQIIDATADLVCAFKPQMAYYSAQNAEKDLLETIKYIKNNHPQILVILDSKRGDIGATSEQYASEAFDRFKADAVTVNPYMGHDSLVPFLEREDKGVIILCKTSNKGSSDFQDLLIDDEPLYLHVARKCVNDWNKYKNINLVVGATNPNELEKIRKLVGDTPLLIPGIGAQGGDLQSVLKAGLINNEGLFISSSRSIIYADSSKNFAQAAREEALKLHHQINSWRNENVK